MPSASATLPVLRLSLPRVDRHALQLDAWGRAGKKMRGLFGLERLVQPQDWFRLGEHAVRRCEQIAQGILQRTSGRLLYEFDTLSDTLCQVLDAAELASELSPDPHHVEASMAVAKQLNEYMQSLNGNTALFEALIAGAEPRTAEEHEMVRSLARDFALRGGVQATAAQRRRIQELQQRIEMSEREVLRQAQRVRPPDPDTPHRPAGDTAVVRCLSTLLAQRQQLAGVLGYRSYADLALADRLIGSPENAWRLLNVLRKAFTMAEHGGNILQLMRRDMRVDRSEMLNEPRSFLALPQVLAGLQRLTRHLFGIALTPVRERDEAATAVWHPAVRAYRLVDVERGEQPVGELYLDLHERDGKREQAAHYALRGGRQGYRRSVVSPAADAAARVRTRAAHAVIAHPIPAPVGHTRGAGFCGGAQPSNGVLCSRRAVAQVSGTERLVDHAQMPGGGSREDGATRGARAAGGVGGGFGAAQPSATGCRSCRRSSRRGGRNRCRAVGIRHREQPTERAVTVAPVAFGGVRLVALFVSGGRGDCGGNMAGALSPAAPPHSRCGRAAASRGVGLWRRSQPAPLGAVHSGRS
eukprot:ctg_44.g17